MLTAQLDDEQLDRLEQQLTIDVAHLKPGTDRDTRKIAGEPERVLVPGRRDLEEAAADLLSAARRGVQIAPQVESRPLVPLYEAAGTPIPPPILIDRDRLGYEHYLVEITFSAMLPEDQQPLRAEFALRLDDDIVDPPRRLRPTELFPDRENIELFRVDLEGAIGLDANMKFTVPQDAGQPVPIAKLDAETRLKAGIAFGPLSFPFRKAKIEVTGISAQDVIWRYDLQSALLGRNVFKSTLLLKIAREAKRADLGAALSLVPYKRKWAVFKDRLPVLTARSSSAIELVPA